jgi:hypothetical protein
LTVINKADPAKHFATFLSSGKIVLSRIAKAFLEAGE